MTRTGRTRTAVIAAALALALPAGCAGDPADQDLCARYAELGTAVEELREAPIATDSAEAFQESVDAKRARAEEVRDRLNAIQMVSEGRLDTAIGEARQRAAEIRESLVVARYEAADALAPQVEAVQEDLDAAWARLDSALQTQCPDQ